MYCPSVVDLNLPDPAPASNKKLRKSSKKQKSPEKVILNHQSALSKSQNTSPIKKGDIGPAVYRQDDIVVAGVDVNFDEIRSAEDLNQSERKEVMGQSKTSSFGGERTTESQKMRQTFKTELGKKNEGAIDLSSKAQYLSLTLNEKKPVASAATGKSSCQKSYKSGGRLSIQGASIKGASR